MAERRTRRTTRQDDELPEEADDELPEEAESADGDESRRTGRRSSHGRRSSSVSGIPADICAMFVAE